VTKLGYTVVRLLLACEPFAISSGAAMPSERESVQLEKRKFELDAEIRRRDLAIKEAEAKRIGLSPAQTTIAGAVLALVSGVAGALITAWSSQSIETGKSLTSLQIEELRTKGNLDIERSKQLATESLERKKFETSLILEAIKTSSRVDAIRNLKFFVAAGFVSDPDGKIARLSDESLPSISTPSQESAGRALRATGTIHVVSPSEGKFVCTGVGISPQHVVTVNFCITGCDPSEEFRIQNRKGHFSAAPDKAGRSVKIGVAAGRFY
jgi:hypothetical protein